MFIINDYKVCEIKDLKIPYSSKVRVEDLWIEITNKIGEKHLVSVIYRHPRGDVELFTEHLENSLSKIENDRTIKQAIITRDFNIDVIKFDLNNNTNECLSTMLNAEKRLHTNYSLAHWSHKSRMHIDRSYSLSFKKQQNANSFRKFNDRYE